MTEKPMPAVRDRATVDASGNPLEAGIEGAVFRPAVTHFDERGELTEIWSQGWGLVDEPVPHVYQVVAAPGSIRAWLVHYLQTDRLFFSMGRLRVVLYDDREGSATRGRLQDLVAGERRRGLLVIPPGVYHGVQNLGSGEAVYINLPTRAFDHAHPDKYRLPHDSDRIPFRFEAGAPRRSPAER